VILAQEVLARRFGTERVCAGSRIIEAVIFDVAVLRPGFQQLVGLVEQGPELAVIELRRKEDRRPVPARLVAAHDASGEDPLPLVALRELVVLVAREQGERLETQGRELGQRKAPGPPEQHHRPFFRPDRADQQVRRDRKPPERRFHIANARLLRHHQRNHSIGSDECSG
jgi:hypothetical protein